MRLSTVVSRLSALLPHLGEVLAMAAGVGVVAVADLSGLVTLHNFAAGPTHNAVIAGLTYGIGGAVGMFARVAVLSLLQRRKPARAERSNLFARLQ